MAANKPSDQNNNNRNLISVPFLWEEKPGTPIREWKHSFSPAKPPPPSPAPRLPLPPARLVVSEPFHWEEKPRKPLSLFSNHAPALVFRSLAPDTGGYDTDSSYCSAPSSDDYDTDATGNTTSLVGAPFLKQLFPLLPPDSNRENKTTRFETGEQRTLGELIMMSRRRDYLKKADGVKKQSSSSMEFMKRNAFGCCIFGSNESMGGLTKKWRQQLELELM